MPLSLTEMRARVARLQTACDKNEGRLATLMEKLKTDFDCKTVAQGQASLKKMQDVREKQIKQLEPALRELEADILAAEDSLACD